MLRGVPGIGAGLRFGLRARVPLLLPCVLIVNVPATPRGLANRRWHLLTPLLEPEANNRPTEES